MTAHTNQMLIEQIKLQDLQQYYTAPMYHIYLIRGTGIINIDFVEFKFEGSIALFTTPYQHLKIAATSTNDLEKLSFHSDFYCIEYHKKEVSCNGLLFNNIYQQPFIYLHDEELNFLFNKIKEETTFEKPYTVPVLRSYLQLILAISIRIKRSQEVLTVEDAAFQVGKFRDLLEAHFIEERTPLFYAETLAMPPHSFTRQCKKYFGKSPSQLIQERVILEAKKHLHLSHRSSKEIAALMNFDDQHYFSRYFKKHTGVSPTKFRKDVGISIVAELSIN